MERATSRLILSIALCGSLGALSGCGDLIPTPVDPPTPAAAPTTPADPGPMETVEATAGVGQQGQALQDENINQAIATPAIAYFGAQQRIVFEVQVPQAVNLYAATNGKGPQTHDEFMNQVLKPNGISLPPLPPGQTYEWDAEQQKLMVIRPAAKP